MAPHSPTPDEAQQVFFLLKWWRELSLALIGLLSAGMLVRKGRGMDTVPIYLTDRAIKDMLEAHHTNVALELAAATLASEAKMRKEFYEAMSKNNADLIERFRELLDAHV